MKDSNDKAAPTAEEVFKERYPTIHDHQYHEVFGWFQDGYLTGKRHAVAQASPVGPSTEAGQTATHYDSLHEAYTDLEKCKGLYTELQTLSKNKIESLSKELQEARAKHLEDEKLWIKNVADHHTLLQETRAALAKEREIVFEEYMPHAGSQTLTAQRLASRLNGMDAALASSTSKEVEP